jgi:hypothetical protein
MVSIGIRPTRRRSAALRSPRRPRRRVARSRARPPFAAVWSFTRSPFVCHPRKKYCAARSKGVLCSRPPSFSATATDDAALIDALCLQQSRFDDRSCASSCAASLLNLARLQCTGGSMPEKPGPLQPITSSCGTSEGLTRRQQKKGRVNQLDRPRKNVKQNLRRAGAERVAGDFGESLAERRKPGRIISPRPVLPSGDSCGRTSARL